ncbi:MAG: lipid-A-disaccharide synthase, partial [Flavobacteriales bacterium]
AGEASGDLHASNLVKALKLEDSSIHFRGWGGDLMQEAGVDVVKHYRELAFMGFIEVIMNLRTILGNLKKCKADIEEFQPDCLILIDYPGFNLRIAEWAHEKGIKVYYYISPQVWAWKKNRVFKIKKVVDEMFVILPFEKDFYSTYDIEVNYVGHPLLDVIKQEDTQAIDSEQFRSKNELDERPIIALLPGSRKQEITSMLSVMISMVPKFSSHQFVIAGAPSQDPEFYQNILKKTGVKVIFGQTYELFKNAQAGLVTSGTATLEAALFKMPQVVCYKGNPLSYYIARWLVDIKYISLVNLILDNEAVVELIQGDFNQKKLESELKLILPGGDKRENVLQKYNQLAEVLGGGGASKRTAIALLKNWHDSSR